MIEEKKICQMAISENYMWNLYLEWSLQNFHRDLEEEDEAYDTLRSSDRRTFTKQLDILQ